MIGDSMEEPVTQKFFDDQENFFNTKVFPDILKIRETKFKQYGNSYKKFYDRFGLVGMSVDRYRTFDRFENIARNYTEQDIIHGEEEITNILYDQINYCLLQLHYLNERYWKGGNNGTNP